MKSESTSTQTNSVSVSLKIREDSLCLSQAMGLTQKAATSFSHPVRCWMGMDRPLFYKANADVTGCNGRMLNGDGQTAKCRRYGLRRSDAERGWTDRYSIRRMRTLRVATVGCWRGMDRALFYKANADVTGCNGRMLKGYGQTAIL